MSYKSPSTGGLLSPATSYKSLKTANLFTSALHIGFSCYDKLIAWPRRMAVVFSIIFANTYLLCNSHQIGYPRQIARGMLSSFPTGSAKIGYWGIYMQVHDPDLPFTGSVRPNCYQEHLSSPQSCKTSSCITIHNLHWLAHKPRAPFESTLRCASQHNMRSRIKKHLERLL